MTNHLALILAQDDDVRLCTILHMTDRYDLFEEMDAAGTRAPWETVMAWQTCGDVARWVGELVG